MRIPLLLSTVTLLAAAVDVDIDLSAMRGQAPADLSAMPASLQARFHQAADAITAASGSDPRQTANRLHLHISDARQASLVLAGVPAEALRQRIAERRPQATPVVLAIDVLGIGLAGAPAPTAIPPVDGAPIALHFTPVAEPHLPIMRHVTQVDATADGHGAIKAMITSPSTVAAVAVEKRLAGLRDHPPILLPLAARAVLAGMAVQRYDSIVHVAFDIPGPVRQAWLHLAMQRLASRLQAD